MNADQMKEFVELCKHPAIAGKRGEWVMGDLVSHRDEIAPVSSINDDGVWVRSKYAVTNVFLDNDVAVWLPPVFDYQHPERGLWGMVDWQYVHTANYMTDDGDFWLYDKRGAGSNGEFSGPLPLVLVKTIIWQHERKEP